MIGDQTKRETDALLNLAEDVARRARARGVDHAEVRARSGSELSVRVRMQKPELIEEAGHRSLGMRVIKDQRVALTSTSDLTPAGIARFIDDALDLVSVSERDAFAGPADPSLRLAGPPRDLDLFDPAVGEIGADQAIEWAMAGENAALSADSRITNSNGASVSRTSGYFAMVLDGWHGVGAGSYASLSVAPLAEEEGGKKRRGHHYTAKRHRSELDTPENVGAEAARRTLRSLGARKIASRELPVVFDKDVAPSLLGLLAGCAMGGSIWRSSSYLVGKEDQLIASRWVNIVDDPLIVRGPGSRPFDGEGLESRVNVLVQDGRLATYLCDSYSARKLGRASTASAGRGAGGGVSASTTNLIMKAGELSFDALIGDIEEGVLVTETMGFGFNAVTGDFSRGAAGFWIEKGKVSHPINEFTISLNFNDLWARVDGVANDLVLRGSTAAPSFRVSAMTVAGSGPEA